MRNILIFGGTTEGRELAHFFQKNKIKVHVCVATEYGKSLLEESEWIAVHPGRLETDEMKQFIETLDPDLIIDATHPYAVLVTENIRNVCRELNKEYCRLCRNKSGKADDCVYVNDMQAAVEYLSGTKGNILLTTGSKELDKWTILKDAGERVFPRILPSADMIEKAAGLGFSLSNLICMQGPFSEEMNYALIRQKDIKWLVTKESGSTGGFEEKIESTRRAGIQSIVIGRPPDVEGISLTSLKKRLADEFGLQTKRHITIAGIGPGAAGSMTAEVLEACRRADVLIGAKRMTEAFSHLKKDIWHSYQPDEIAEYITKHTEYENVAVLMSGDTGFYSGCKKLTGKLREEELRILPGVSSLSYFSSRLGVSWDDAEVISLHGKEQTIAGHIKNNKKLFVLADTGATVSVLCRELLEYGREDVTMAVGENLSYPEERICTGTPGKLKEQKFSGLCVIYIENQAAAEKELFYGIEDERFIRQKVPMTKEEVRRTSLAKLKLREDSVLYDIGAGTGSVSVEAALASASGIVYAVECKEEAVSLLQENKKKFQVPNMKIISGLAPEALKELEPPTHVFIGGTKGNLEEIIRTVQKKNLSARFVITAITLETVTQAIECLKKLPVLEEEIICMNISKSEKIGDYHMMKGNNPVYIISFTGGKR